ncbi:MAG: SPASM domain-containing protein [Lachnospiraceae bacterium]|jgi:organic radical activating enzyme|nr:SPASM domain-containing protein [Lachnospiraceae bacterium]
MTIKIHNFGGVIGWNLQKILPRLSSGSYLKLQFAARRKSQQAYIDYFFSQETPPPPLIVNLETINRCNGECAFCCANRHADKRPLKRMTDEMYYRIINELKEWGYKGHLVLYGNNEPWLDTRIVDFHRHCREQLPDSYIFMSTNGTLLNVEKFCEIAPYINQLIINNYCEDMKLRANVQEVYEYAKAHAGEFPHLEVLIQIRYAKAVLTNRAGSAPNKKAAPKIIRETCLMPYTDMFIFPDGRLGLCCCDNLEATTLADLNDVRLREAWNSAGYQELRQALAGGRHNYPFCKHCDFIDAGLRMDAVEDVVAGREMRGARQTVF